MNLKCGNFKLTEVENGNEALKTQKSPQHDSARMKEGEPCDLLDRLAGDPAFGMTRTELDAVMEPKLYIGRCKQQVERFLDECEPLLKDAAAADGQISL